MRSRNSRGGRHDEWAIDAGMVSTIACSMTPDRAFQHFIKHTPWSSSCVIGVRVLLLGEGDEVVIGEPAENRRQGLADVFAIGVDGDLRHSGRSYGSDTPVMCSISPRSALRTALHVAPDQLVERAVGEDFDKRRLVLAAHFVAQILVGEMPRRWRRRRCVTAGARRTRSGGCWCRGLRASRSALY